MFRTFSSVFRQLCIKETCGNSKGIHTSVMKLRQVDDRKEMLRSLPSPDEGTVGEKSVDIDGVINKKNVFPHKDLPTQLFNGVAFKDLPIFNIRVSPNNTILSLTDAKGTPKIIRSCGIEGFKNARKGTNVAAQATAIAVGGKALEKGIKTVRVRVQGLGPGRMSAIKGLQMAGMDIVSITDSTRVSWNPPRAKKQRTL